MCKILVRKDSAMGDIILRLKSGIGQVALLKKVVFHTVLGYFFFFFTINHTIKQSLRKVRIIIITRYLFLCYVLLI